jgi:hypothetical protein
MIPLGGRPDKLYAIRSVLAMTPSRAGRRFNIRNLGASQHLLVVGPVVVTDLGPAMSTGTPPATGGTGMALASTHCNKPAASSG